MNEFIIRSVQSYWDRTTCIKWFDVTFADGSTVKIGVPLAHVVATFDAEACRAGLTLAPLVGEVDSVDGLFSSIARAAKSAVKAVSKVVTKTANTIDKGVRTAASVVKSKPLSFGISALGFIPVVGAAALQAHKAAISAVGVYDQGKRALELAKSGLRSAGVMKQISQGQNVQRAIAQIRQRRATPQTRMLTAALKSVA